MTIQTENWKEPVLLKHQEIRNALNAFSQTSIPAMEYLGTLEEVPSHIKLTKIELAALKAIHAFTGAQPLYPIKSLKKNQSVVIGMKGDRNEYIYAVYSTDQINKVEDFIYSTGYMQKMHCYLMKIHQKN